jgi:hypothetical protein
VRLDPPALPLDLSLGIEVHIIEDEYAFTIEAWLVLSAHDQGSVYATLQLDRFIDV